MEQAKTSVGHHPVIWRWGLYLAAGLLLLGWLFNTPAGLLGKSDAVGYAVCHRIDGRSFHLGERALPLCVRCTGMYLGVMLGLAYQAALGLRRGGQLPKRVIFVLGLFVVAFALDGFNSYARLFLDMPLLYEPRHDLRLLTGTGMGLAIAAFLLPAFNQTVWQQWEGRPILGGFLPLGGLVALALLVDGLVLTESPWVLYPAALISAAGVFVILTLIYTMVWLMILRRENLFVRWVQLWLPLTGGFVTALLQIIVLDVVRYWLTGTWDGFHFG